MCEFTRGREYHYEPLNFSKPAIRLLSINPFDENCLLTCNLRAYELEFCPSYTALSYEWGEHSPLFEITINGRSLGIRHNLWLFLSVLKERQMRGELPADLRLWVDALCINQRDLSERNAQVSMMGSIYRQAISVFAWLGWPQGWNPKWVFNFFQEYISRLSMERVEVLEMVLHMCTCQYWSRRWILQEIMLAQDVWIFCGESYLSWFSFAHFFNRLGQWRIGQNIEQHGKLSSVVAQLHRTIPSTIHRYKDGQRNYPQRSICQLLLAFRATKCEVVHDQVYSLLSLATDGSTIPVDYSCSPQRLIFQVMAQPRRHWWLEMQVLAKDFGISGSSLNKFGFLAKPNHSAFLSMEESCFVTGQISSCVSPLGIKERDVLHGLVRKDQALVPSSVRASIDNYIKSTHRRSACPQEQIYYRSNDDNRDFVQVMNKENPPGMVRMIRLPPTWDRAERASVFMCDDGSMGLSCPNARAGDFVCDFAPLGRLVVRREHENDWHLIGTATCNHIFGMTEGVPALSSIAESIIEQKRYIEFLEPACSPDSSMVADLLLQDEAHVLDSITSYLQVTQLFSETHATNSALRGTRLAISVPIWDLALLAFKRTRWGLSDDSYVKVFEDDKSLAEADEGGFTAKILAEEADDEEYAASGPW
ncbi:hypothetical protein GJ744_003009 [Endocarpon pusillum]|uniref:Heterokaryon incompatibility domain-containing protein n=1 Tax=Endocarpon pusillum TaxID=364733 RepID=A0A8H7A7E7_9EURO|nr:hypothetical protein GJ744_003009 [Endocarpon pusillum]